MTRQMSVAGTFYPARENEVDHLQRLTITYECESSLGNSLNLKEMTGEFLKIFLEKTSAVYANINEVHNENTFLLNSVGEDAFYKLTIKAKPNDIDTFCVVNIKHKAKDYHYLYIALQKYYLTFVYSKKNQINLETVANIFYSLKNKILLGIKVCKEHERLELALLASENGLWDWDLRNDNVYYSPRWKDMLGYSDNELKNEFSTWKDRVHPDDLELVLKDVQENIDGKKEYYKGSFRLKHKNGNWVWILAHGKAVFDENNLAIRMAGMHTDITKQKEAEKTLREQTKTLDYQANHDHLTSLPNRVLFHDRLEQAIQKAKRENSKIALLFIDLDHFKEINDSLGHNIGDEVLVTTASRLSASIRDEDTLARLGGDEFIIILEELSEIQDAALVSKKILDNLSQTIYIGGATLYVSSSIGISIYPDDGISTQDLLKFADFAMYKAKDEGRNNFQYYSSACPRR